MKQLAGKTKIFTIIGSLLTIGFFLAVFLSSLLNFSVPRANAIDAPINFANDTFTAANGTLLQNHVSDSGATWTKSTGGGASNLTVDTDRIYSPVNGSGWTPYYTSALSTNADYDIQADIRAPYSGASSFHVCGRIATNSLDAYCAGLNNGVWKLYKRVGSTITLLGQYVGDISGANAATVMLRMRGTQLEVYINGVNRISATDSSLTAAGRAGIAAYYTDPYTSLWIDNWSASNSDSGTTPPPGDTTAPSVPTNLTTATVSTSQINLSWTASTDNVGVTGYKVFRGGVQIATSTGITYSDTGLTASTTYSYTVAAADLEGNVSAQSSPVIATTQSATVPPPSDSFTFTATGDIGATAATTVTLQSMAAQGGAFSLALGDLSYNQLVPETAWCDYVKNIFGQTYPFELEVGNHENGIEAGGPNGYIENFVQCLPDRLGAIGTYGRQYYFDYPSTNPLARFIMLPAGESAISGGPRVNYENGSAEQQWLNTTIDEARASGIKWIIVGMHMLCPTIGEKGCQTWQASPGPDLFNFLVSKKVDLVLHGHDHNYQRSKQFALSASCPSIPVQSDATPNAVADLNCIVDSDDSLTRGAGTVVVISGITPNYLWPADISWSDPEAPYFKAAQNNNYGYTKVTVSASQLTSQFVPTGTPHDTPTTFSDVFTITDSGTVPLPVPDTTAPSVPTNLAATTVSTSQINLSWTAATDNVGVTGYRVFRSGMQVGTSTGIAYSDTGLTASTTYSYAVAAFDAAGNTSVQSNEASATTQAAGIAIINFANDTFTAANGTLLQNHVSDSGATWTKSTGGGASNLTVDTDRIYSPVNGSGWTPYYTSALSTNADYDIQADIRAPYSGASSFHVCGRIATNSLDAYCAGLNNGVWKLYKRVGSTITLLGQYVGDISGANAATVMLRMRGTQLEVYINGVNRISATDSSLTAAGRAGIAAYYTDPYTSLWIDNWSASNAGTT